ncbi:hypothetical protein [Pseudooceanicola sp. MF1-13]|uniref:hypothetical protein n=1 Tax=Pseudooceanicola sp. MF1-13 TaxID=3379095 RepID=UPI0038923267
MYGVVLWRCQGSKCAVIWCDDHGDLAFLNAETDLAGIVDNLEPGDLLRFDLRSGAEMREACNASRVTRDFAPDLAHMLDDQVSAARTDTAPEPSTAHKRAPARTARVVAFAKPAETEAFPKRRAAAS